MPLHIVVNGAAGRMGRRIVALVAEDRELTVAAALEAPDHPEYGRDAGELAGVGRIGVPLKATWEGKADVLVDFSTPTATAARLAECRARRLPMVIGTTGLAAEQHAAIDAAARELAVLQSPNMSVGMSLLFKLAGEIAWALGEDYDVEIVETHHRFKADAPSGTALALAESICAAAGRDLKKDVVYGRQGQAGPRTRREIGMHAIRAGDAAGEHAVIYGALGERIELRHTATTRDTFVRGALRAAKWLAGKPAGRYSMRNVLGM